MWALNIIKKNGNKLNVRVCVTGPVELYLKQFGGTAYADVLNNFAVSIDRFISNSLDNAKNFRISTISIDEPSIGINPQIMFSDNDLIAALEKASKDGLVAKKWILRYISIHRSIISLYAMCRP